MAIKFIQQDRLAWRQFMSSQAGMRGLLKMEDEKPSITKEDQAHNLHFQAGIVQGYNKMLADLRALALDEEKPEATDEFQPLESTRQR